MSLSVALVLLWAIASVAQPRPEEAALPDMAALLEQVLENQNQVEEARNDYTYTKTECDVAIDGNAKESPVRTYEVFSVHGRRVEKLVARSDRPLTPHEARREEERIEKLIRDHAKKASEREDAAKRTRVENEEGDDDLTVADLLRVCQFVNARRETFRGREVLTCDFEPRPGAKPRGRVESWIQKLRGRVWIDEHAKRILLLKGYNIHQTQRFSDYRKFAVETSSEIKPPEP